MRILLAEDDELLGSGLRAGLDQRGFQVDWVRDGVAAERELLGAQHQAAVLDIGLPRQDGLAVLKAVRARGIDTPVLVLTARDAVAQRIEGLNLGADDYVVKPFSARELLARIRAVMRRAREDDEDGSVAVGPIRIDGAAHRVFANDQPVPIGPTEYRLLHFFMTHPERVYTRAQLLDHVWGGSVYVEERTIDVHIRRLRKTLEPFNAENMVQTVRGAGYRFSTAT